MFCEPVSIWDYIGLTSNGKKTDELESFFDINQQIHYKARNGKYRNGKVLEGSTCGLIEALSRLFPGTGQWETLRNLRG
jgi:hypothetical protein